MKIGTVGTGFIVDTFMEAAAQIPGIQVEAVYSRTAEKAKALGDKYDIPRRYTDRDAFLSDGGLDFIYVASPNSLHYGWCRDALAAGRNVICEKPFVTTSAQLEELVQTARQKGLFLFEAITVPHLPNFRLLRSRLGEIGDIKLCQMNFSQYSSRYAAFKRGENPNVFSPAFSGGALMDINYYNLYFAYGLFGRPRAIRYFPNMEEGIDTSGVLVLQYDGFVCSAVGCKDSKSRNLSQIQGDGGWIVVPEETSRCVEVQVFAGGKEASYNQQPVPNALYYELTDFCAMFEAGDLAGCHRLLEDSLAVTALVEEARLAAGVAFADDKA